VRRVIGYRRGGYRELVSTDFSADLSADFEAVARAADAADPLAKYRAEFVIDDEALIYLDGNSLGRLPRATRARLHAAIDGEWGSELIRAWDHWIDLATEAGDVIAELIGAAPGEVALSDSTSVNLYKLAVAACDARPDRRVIVTDDDNFPTDRYVLAGVAAARGMRLRVLPTDMDEGIRTEDVAAALGPDTALVSLSHVAYRSGAIADLDGITAAAHEVGALTLWDLSHSGGSVPVGLSDAGADLAVGCTYKHLNGGPGAPAYLYLRRDLQPALRQPIWGWFSQQSQFDMAAEYHPVDTIERFCVGTPAVLGGYAALEGARLSAAAGIEAIAAKARALTAFAVDMVDAWFGAAAAPEKRFALASPRDPLRRGAQITLRHGYAWQISQACKAERVIPDFRTPDRLRLGFAPLYTRFIDVYEGMRRLRSVIETGAYHSFGADRSRVT
jgi:kynureninase